MRPPRPRALVPMVADAAARLSQALGYANGKAANGQPQDETAPLNWPQSAIEASRPHSIFR